MQTTDISYTLTRKPVKHVRLCVREDGSVHVVAPLLFPKAKIEEFLEKRQSWIEKKQAFFRNREKIQLQFNEILLFGNRYTYFYDTTYTNKVVVNEEFRTIRARRNLTDIAVQEQWLKSLAKKHFEERTGQLSTALNMPYNKLFVRTEKRKWGNCSSLKNISLNWRLVKAPTFVIDYVIVHELVHTIVMSHSNKFWTLLRAHYPDYEKAQQWLEKYGSSL